MFGYLHPIHVIGVNGLHAAVLVRVEMFRAGRTCELLMTRHWPDETKGGKRPPLESKIIFRGVHGFLEAEVGRKSGDATEPGLPVFYSRAGELVEIPPTFHAAVEAVAKGIRCEGCSHCHYLAQPVAASPVLVGAEIGSSSPVGSEG